MTCWLCGFEATELTTDAKAPTCNEGPCQICLAVSNVDEEINQAVATLRRLLAKRCDLRSEQNRVHGTLIHRLPTELKNHIFQFLVPKRSEWYASQPSILPYISVCRNWRDIAFSNPLFWSTIHITLPGKAPLSDPSSRINFVRDWILRSGSLPLTLDVVAYEEGCSEEEWKGLIDNFSQSSNRWHSLSLDLSSRLLRSFPRSNFQCHLLRNLRIIASGWLHDELVPLSNMSPENIEIVGIHIQSLQISWNHLTSATVTGLDFEDFTQLFQHASQMTYCHILDAYHHQHRSFSIPSIIHHRLQTLSFVNFRAAVFFGCLTLPCLREFYAADLFHLKYLPALVRRSSCPLTRITFDFKGSRDTVWGFFDNLEPLPGLTDLLLEGIEDSDQAKIIMKLLLDEYYPDLRHLTLRLEPFRFLWDQGVIITWLNPKRSRLDGTTNGRHREILVIDQHRTDEALDMGKQLKALGLDIRLTEDGFEILMPCVNIDLLASRLPLRLAVR